MIIFKVVFLDSTNGHHQHIPDTKLGQRAPPFMCTDVDDLNAQPHLLHLSIEVRGKN